MLAFYVAYAMFVEHNNGRLLTDCPARFFPPRIELSSLYQINLGQSNLSRINFIDTTAHMLFNNRFAFSMSKMPISKTVAFAILLVAIGTLARIAHAADPILAGYATPQEFDKQVTDLAKLPNVTVKSLTKTKEGRDVWLVTLGSEAKHKPAILIVGNVEPSHLLGSEAAVRMARQLAKEPKKEIEKKNQEDKKKDEDGEKKEADSKIEDDKSKKEENTDSKSAQKLLDRVTIYIIPRPSPDATAKCWKTLLDKPTGNARMTDDDRDGETGEDPSNDLNGDNLITMMRVADPQGQYRVHPDDARALIEADPKKNEKGAFNLYSEGRDDDHDEQFNEDGATGVNFNRNFTHKYAFFKPGSGPHQVSEPETRAVADFCFDHQQIAVVFTFTPEDNLVHPWKPGQEAGPIKRFIARDDAPQADFIAKHYTEILSGKNAPDSPVGSGSFSDWAYFHFGRWSFASRGWWIPEVEKPKNEKDESSEKNPAKKKNDDDTTDKKDVSDKKNEESAKKPDAKAAAHDDDDDDSTKTTSQQGRKRPGAPKVETQDGKEQLNALRWLEREKIPGFVEWKKIDHPDFPNQTIEVGGFHPLVLLNPPAKELDGIAEKHTKFIEWLAGMLPKLEIHDVKTESLGKGIYRIKLKVANTGYLATTNEMGHTTHQVPPVVWEWNVPEGTEWLQGTRRGFVERLSGMNGQSEHEWLVRVLDEKAATIKLQVGAPSVGAVTQEIELKP